ncbi:MAG: hypothetical protein L6R37_006937 [Teloschistes peruensis]|nr:MAG: hypothetical protein L6R37_006937 [Teloschistes peruensis]
MLSLSSHGLFFLPLFLSHLPSTLAAPSTGDVSLWSDSSCQPGATPSFSLPDPIALNHTLPADSCYTLPNAAHSYIVNSRPTCSDGSTAGFAYYNGQNCRAEGFGSAFNSGDTGDTTNDGLCLALVEFNSLAFLCEGVDERGDGKSSTATITVLDGEGTGVATVVTSTMGGSVTTSAAAAPPFSGSSSSSSPSSSSLKTSAPIIPVQTPLYPLPTARTVALHTGTGTAVGTGGLPLGSPSSSIPFKGAGRLAFGEVSVLGVVGLVGVVVSFC